ncbi:hypothetical protein F7725_000910 [Dissostichus mawsoni]|uniref:EGF-like domain-containing protein n=1 Tax=Dissostichus mawsoni TaxID=36200 RepID=A0A7J5ZFS1_DISMA|nr:hypothetical protein F7725_000910 [Dissostichus mawsoni]
MSIQRASLFLCCMILCMDICLSQKDCTGVDCQDLQGCIETVLETDACCPTCKQKGCTCEGYQYYDCVQAGFQRGKVPEGESYFVDFGSTECSCPAGGGKIECHFIPCPEIPQNCIDVLQPADGCPQCRRIGCTHGNQKYEAGHSFQVERCQVCHCPNDGGQLMCLPNPDCDPHGSNNPMQHSPLRDIGSHHDNRQTSPGEPFSKLALGNTLPLYKQDPPSFGRDDYDSVLAGSMSSTIQDLAQPLESTTTSPDLPESSSTSFSLYDDRRHELREAHKISDSERGSEAEVTQNWDPTTTGAQRETSTLLTTTTTQRVTAENRSPQQEVGDRNSRHNSSRNRVEDPLKDTTHTARGNKGARHHKHSQANDMGNNGALSPAVHKEQEKVSVEHEEPLGKDEQASYPTIQFSPTSRVPVRMREDEEQPRRQPQTLLNYQPQDLEGDTEVSAKELVKTCCETGEKWASANGHCNNMEPPTRDRHSICWSAVTAALWGCSSAARGSTTRLGNVLRGEESRPENQDVWHSVRERPALYSTPQPEKGNVNKYFHTQTHTPECECIACSTSEGMLLWACVSDSRYPKEAFSIGEEQDGENAVEGGVEVEDMNECLIHEGNICHHRCVNTPLTAASAFQDTCCRRTLSLVLQTLDEENRLKEDDRVAVEPTSTPPPPTQPSVPLNPCEGNGPCEQHCTSVGGRPQCSCFPGYSLMANGGSCEGKELKLSYNAEHIFSHHTRGTCGFFCDHINECLSASACQFDERCRNTAGSYICQRPISCPPGYQINNDICEDINECVQLSHNCGLGFECVNTEGSFRCNPKPQCPVGFNRDAQGNCIDIDECSNSAQPCSLGFNCINTVGSYICQRKILCSRGYHASPDGSRCIDVDECQSSLHRCGEGQLCNNLPGSYRCECQTGYQYDSFRRMCVDVNECWRYQGLLCAQTCENTRGSYECSCTSGFRLSGDGKTCEDVNECLASPCSQECANIFGSYQCYCRTGYKLREDGHTCEDTDECTESIGHLCTYKCVNVPGSYQCACPEYGYTMSANGRSCRDIDECATGAHNCSLAETCYNIQGAYRCLSFDCPPNYRKVSDTRCERINCPNYLDCQNSPLRITYYYLSFQSNIVVPAQIFRIGPSPAYSGDNVIVSITEGNEENYFSTRKLNAYTGAVYLNRQVEAQRDLGINVEMKLWRQGTFTTFQAKIFVFITSNLL